MKATRLSLFALVLLFIPFFAFAQYSDTTPAELVSLDFSPREIDTTSGAQPLTVTLHLTDDLSGVNSACVQFVSPSLKQYQSVCMWRLISGTQLDGIFEETLAFPRFTESGVWKIASVGLWDRVNNYTALDTAALTARGFPTDLTVISEPDVTPPVVKGLVFTPDAPDVTSAARQIDVRLTLQDDTAGVEMNMDRCLCFSGQLIVVSPSGHQKHYIFNTLMALEPGGTDMSGTWLASFTLPQFSEPGAWTVQVEVRDKAGNYGWYTMADLANMGITPSFNVASATPDLTPPQLSALSFTPIAINTSTAAQTVTFDLTASDDLSGVDLSPDSSRMSYFYGVEFESPSGMQRTSIGPFQFAFIGQSPAGGAIWQGTGYFPQYSEAGTWRLKQLTIKDTVKNTRDYFTADLVAAGMPTELTVIKPSLVIDGTIGPAGGTVQDATFEERAQLTVPSGMFSADTTVAIDVLTSPLAIPAPNGYSTQATYYVNIELWPAPSNPLPPPGITLVLPLVSPLQAGQTVALFSVDATGHLAFVDGATGTVDPGGLTATFTGVTHLSTFAGFLPDVITIAIDIKPGDALPTINPNASGTTPVALLGSPAFNPVTMVNRSSLTFGHSGSETTLSKCNPNGEDVNRDGRLDLVCHFTTNKAAFQSGDTKGVLRGRTTSNVSFEGVDAIRVK